MYKVSVPMLESAFRDPERLFRQLHRMKADRIFLASKRHIEDEEGYREDLAFIKRALPMVRQEGFEVGIWIGQTIGHGGMAKPVVAESGESYRFWADMDGVENTGCFCPCGEPFLRHIERWVRDLAALKPALLMVDDDFRTSMRGDTMGCLCDYHLARYNREIGEELTREQIKEKVFCGGKSRYRDVWLKMQGESLYEMARRMRKACDEVDPSIRMGYCSCPSNWDVDGVDAFELTRIFAGNNEPFIRLTGAPYWCNHDASRLGGIIEHERLMGYWCKDKGIEAFSEGDTYPRPRMRNPAAFLENFDLALRADGNLQGILKYTHDYVSGPAYETGYYEAHCRNLPLYEAVEQTFGGKTAVGLQVIEPIHLMDKTEFSTPCAVPGWYGWERMPARSVRFTAACSLPVAFEESDGACLAFSEAAYSLTPAQRKRGVVLNITAARILQKQGVDVGLAAVGEPTAVDADYFPDEDETAKVLCNDNEQVYPLTPKPGARVVSEAIADGTHYPDAYEYENADGERYLVLGFVGGNDALARTYCRQRQMAASIARISGKPLPAVCPGHPDLYIQCQKGDGTLTVGLWNLFPDPVYAPTVTLGKPGEVIDTLQCEATADGTTVQLSTDIPPFGFAAVTVRQ